MPAGASSLGQQRREAQHPPVDSDVVNLNAAFDQELLDVAVGQAEAQVPADRQHDHVGWKAEAGEGRSCERSSAGAARSHGGSLPADGSHTADATAPVRVGCWWTGVQLERHRAYLRRRAAPAPSRSREQAANRCKRGCAGGHRCSTPRPASSAPPWNAPSICATSTLA